MVKEESQNLTALKLLLLISSLVSLGFFAKSAQEDNFGGEWRKYQSAYKKFLFENAADQASLKTAENFDVEQKQLYLAETGRIDRCVNCHVSIDDPKMKNAKLPLRTHPGDYLETHPIERVGCTVCHEGQGRATIKEDAHGEVKHWLYPLLKGEYVYTSCGKCHFENDLFGAEQDLFGKFDPLRGIDQEELEAVLPGSERLNRGKALFTVSGCLGCHQYRGKGGRLGSDITYQGDKTKHSYDFTHIEGEHTPRQWLLEHFLEPKRVNPESIMPDFGFSASQAEDLTLFLLSLHYKNLVPNTFLPLPKKLGMTPVTGETLFGLFCSACHGPRGSKGRVNPGYVKERIPNINVIAETMMLFEKEDAQAIIEPLKAGIPLETLLEDPPVARFNVVLAQYKSIFQTIKDGSIAGKENSDGPDPPYHMPRWAERLTDSEVNALIAFLLGEYPWEEEESAEANEDL